MASKVGRCSCGRLQCVEVLLHFMSLQQASGAFFCSSV